MELFSQQQDDFSYSFTKILTILNLSFIKQKIIIVGITQIANISEMTSHIRIAELYSFLI